MSTSSLAHFTDLPEGTRRILAAVASGPGIDRFVLVGGTALAMRAGHRLSEDIDLAWTGTRKLPRSGIDDLIGHLKQRGFDVRLATSDAAVVDFSESGGGDLLDYQQDWTADGIKLTFFSPDEPALFKEQHPDRVDALPVANPTEIFDSKALLFSQFCRARDMVDIWWLTEKGGIPIDRFEQVYQAVDQTRNFNTALTRIKGQSYAQSDPGYRALAPDTPDPNEARARIIHRLEEFLIRKAQGFTDSR